MRTLAVGDIHGAALSLDALLAAVRPTPRDRLVFLGDYVDRGPDSRGVIDRLLALKTTHDVTCVRGNHELMMLRARRDAAHRKMWLGVGGLQALASYAPTLGAAGSLADVPAAHWAFLETGCVDWAETDTHVFVHAGLDPDVPMAEQSESALFWEFLTGPIRLDSGKTVVCGHTSQKSGRVLDYGVTICLDTFAYGGGKLTCLDVDRLQYWQADVLGRVTTDRLEPRD